MELSLLERRKIEAGVLGPLIKAFMAELGEERTKEIVQRVIAELARESGRELRDGLEGGPIEKVAACVPQFTRGGALELEVVNRSETEYSFNVTRCKFAEMYEKLGIPELGYLLSCGRDFALTEALSPDLELTRSQTIMEGASHCDFRFKLKESTRGDGG